MKYKPVDFKNSIPDWKRKKDPIIARILYRPVSYYLSALCAAMGISANTVSYFSIVIAAVAGVFFLLGGKTNSIIAAVFVNIWIILDCVDGNIARTVKKQRMGEFADAISGYIVTAISCLTMGYSVYTTGGAILPEKEVMAIVLGGCAAAADPLMRLVYQKYKATLRELSDEGIFIEDHDNHGDHSQVGSIKTRIEERLGFGGILPFLILIGVIFGFLDVVVLYCAVYYLGSCIAMTLLYIKKAISIEKVQGKAR